MQDFCKWFMKIFRILMKNSGFLMTSGTFYVNFALISHDNEFPLQGNAGGKIICIAEKGNGVAHRALQKP